MIKPFHWLEQERAQAQEPGGMGCWGVVSELKDLTLSPKEPLPVPKTALRRMFSPCLFSSRVPGWHERQLGGITLEAQQDQADGQERRSQG